MEVERHPGAAPVRMCIGCRGRSGKAELLRLTWTGHDVQVDLAQNRPGRGAYLHPRSGCLTQALRRRALGRALRLEVAVDLERATVGLLEASAPAR